MCVCLSLLLDDRSFGAPCCCQHGSAGQADPQVVLLQAQQLGAVLQRITRLVLDGAAAWKPRDEKEEQSALRRSREQKIKSRQRLLLADNQRKDKKSGAAH